MDRIVIFRIIRGNSAITVSYVIQVLGNVLSLCNEKLSQDCKMSRIPFETLTECQGQIFLYLLEPVFI